VNEHGPSDETMRGEQLAMPKWWGELDRETQDWIAGHLGEVLPYDIADKVRAVGADLRPTRFLSSTPTAYQLKQRDTRQIFQHTHAGAAAEPVLAAARSVIDSALAAAARLSVGAGDVTPP
jgi:hypothetical protein